MLHKVSDCLRLYAYEVSPDEDRVADRNKTDIRGDTLSDDLEDQEVAVKNVSEDTTEVRDGPGAPRKPGVPQETPRPTAGPLQRAPRRQPSHSREWNPNTRRQKMREYMQKYRGTGQINQRKTQTRGA